MCVCVFVQHTRHKTRTFVVITLVCALMLVSRNRERESARAAYGTPFPSCAAWTL